MRFWEAEGGLDHAPAAEAGWREAEGYECYEYEEDEIDCVCLIIALVWVWITERLSRLAALWPMDMGTQTGRN